jgi:hypothetical protein
MCPKALGACDARRLVVRLLTVASLVAGGQAAGSPRPRPDPASCTVLTSDDDRWGDEIGLLSIDPAMSARVIEQAIDRWQKCDGYASDFPRFVVGPGRGRRVRVRIERREPGAGYCGIFAGETITIHRLARIEARIAPCPPTDRVLAHELGHVLGLRDVEIGRGCPTFIMSEIVERGPALQTVSQAECSAVAKHWITSRERADRGGTDLPAARVLP